VSRRTVQHTLGSYLRHPPAQVRGAIFVAALLVYSTAAFLFFEKPAKPDLDWIDAFWWTLVTICTVGYGDYFPASTGGRLFVGIPTMLTGVGVLSYSLSQVAALLVRSETLRRKGLAMHKVSGHLLVCNYPSAERFAHLLEELRGRYLDAPLHVVLIDETLERVPEEFERQGVLFVRGHPAREAVLLQAALPEAARAVVLARDPRDPDADTLNVATCLTLHALRPDLHIVAECVEPNNLELFRRAGCLSIVCVMDLAPGILAHELHDPGVVGLLEELTLADSAHENNVYVVPIEPTRGGPPTVAALHRWSLAHGATLLGLRAGTALAINPPPSRVVVEGEAALVVSRKRPLRIVLDEE